MKRIKYILKQIKFTIKRLLKRITCKHEYEFMNEVKNTRDFSHGMN